MPLSTYILEYTKHCTCISSPNPGSGESDSVTVPIKEKSSNCPNHLASKRLPPSQGGLGHDVYHCTKLPFWENSSPGQSPMAERGAVGRTLLGKDT